jgi:tetratricopeptide (TPR) repeat protein
VKLNRHLWLALPIAALAAQAAAQVTAAVCGDLRNGYGPYDYRSAHESQRTLVERPHFSPNVEALLRGNSGSLGGEIDYTLRAFPNHPRALNAVMRYGEKMKSPQPRDLRFPVECYFERALRFRPDDHIVRMLFAQFLQRNKRGSEAAAQLALVAEKAGDNAFTHYNLGLLYLDLERPDEALAHAHEAYARGFERPELRQRLQSAGKWSDPPPRTEAAPAAAPASAPTAAADPTRRAE